MATESFYEAVLLHADTAMESFLGPPDNIQNGLPNDEQNPLQCCRTHFHMYSCKQEVVTSDHSANDVCCRRTEQAVTDKCVCASTVEKSSHVNPPPMNSVCSSLEQVTNELESFKLESIETVSKPNLIEGGMRHQEKHYGKGLKKTNCASMTRHIDDSTDQAASFRSKCFVKEDDCCHQNDSDDSSCSAQDYCVDCCDVVFKDGIEYRAYGAEHHLNEIMELVGRDLSEPYSIYTYRYFIYNWPHLCICAMDVELCVGAVVCKMHVYRDSVIRGYIAMLAVGKEYRRRGIGTQLVLLAIKAMIDDDCDEILLEAETDNVAALCLYENLGFIREKRLFQYYLNGRDAFRLQLLLE